MLLDETKNMIRMYVRLNGEYVLQTTKSGLLTIPPKCLDNASLLSRSTMHPLSLQTLGNGQYRVDI